MMKKPDEEALSDLIEICHANLNRTGRHVDYLLKRGISEPLINKYKIGFFPQNIDVLLKFISKEQLIRYNIIDYNGGSDFSNYYNLIIPVYNECGMAVGISGRSLATDEERRLLNISKYKNSSYKKSNLLFGLGASKREILGAKNVFIVEGYFDKVALDKIGLENSVAICGTAFSKNHFLKLLKYTEKMTFMLDSDDAGVRSSESIFSKFSNKGAKLRFLKLPGDYKDVDEYVNFGGKSKFNFFKDASLTMPGIW
jgi:DNA primase